MGEEDRGRRGGLGEGRDPTDEDKAVGGPGAQQQRWPGSETDMDPEADHGEDSYRGSGRLQGLKALITGGDSGIGRAVAIAFLSEADDASKTVRWIEDAGRRAVHVFTKSLAGNLAKRGIRVNCVAPGPVWTPLIPSTRSEDSVEDFGADSAWDRPAQPAELAPAFVFFAAADSRFCTGEILAVSGTTATR